MWGLRRFGRLAIAGRGEGRERNGIRVLAILISGAALSLAAPGPAASDQSRLAMDEMVAFWSDTTSEGIGEADQCRYAMYYAANGDLSGVSRCACCTFRATGSWSINEDGKICLEWSDEDWPNTCWSWTVEEDFVIYDRPPDTPYKNKAAKEKRSEGNPLGL